MFDKIDTWEIFALIIGVVIFGSYISKNVDFEDMLRPQPSEPIHLKGKVASSVPLNKIKVVDIPKEVYDSIPHNPSGAKYLQGNEKYILMIATSTCPYARAFKNAFKKLFKQEGYKEYYRKHIFNVGRSWVVTCNSETCPKMWIFQNCGAGLCIIHPQKKKAIIDNSQDASQIPLLLEKYKEW